MLVYHCFGHAGEPVWRVHIPFLNINPSILRPIQFCSYGVSLFLVLSGFCVFYSYAAPGREGDRPMTQQFVEPAAALSAATTTPKKRKRAFMRVFLRVQALFVIWLIARTNTDPPTAADTAQGDILADTYNALLSVGHTPADARAMVYAFARKLQENGKPPTAVDNWLKDRK